MREDVVQKKQYIPPPPPLLAPSSISPPLSVSTVAAPDNHPTSGEWAEDDATEIYEIRSDDSNVAQLGEEEGEKENGTVRVSE